MKPGGYGWIAVAGFIALLDAYLVRKGYDSLSTVFGDTLLKPHWRWVPILISTYLMVHLWANVICEAFPVSQFRKYDPLGALTDIIKKEAHEAIRDTEEIISQIIETIEA